MASNDKRGPFRARKRRGYKKGKFAKGGILSSHDRLAKLGGHGKAITLPSLKTLIAPTLFTKMYWSVYDYILTPIADEAHHTIRISSIYDPGYTWSGIANPKDTSSRGFSVISPLYNQYRVYGAKVVVRMWNTSNCDVLVQLSTNAATGPANVTLPDLVERQEGSLSKILAAKVSGNENSTVEFTVWIPCNLALGMTKEQFRTDDTTVASIGGNPSLAAYLHLQAWNIHQGGYKVDNPNAVVNVAQLGDSVADITTTSSSVGYSLKMVQSVQFIKRKLGLAL